MTRRGFAAAAIGLVAAVAAPAATPEKEAQKVAEVWLALIDQGKYGESWDEAAGFFKERLKRDQWGRIIGQVRGPFGSLASRSLLSAQFLREVPGAPDGEYVVIQFKASFANKKNAVETVTPMKDSDGVWRVSGYQVK